MYSVYLSLSDGQASAPPPAAAEARGSSQYCSYYYNSDYYNSYYYNSYYHNSYYDSYYYNTLGYAAGRPRSEKLPPLVRS